MATCLVCHGSKRYLKKNGTFIKCPECKGTGQEPVTWDKFKQRATSEGDGRIAPTNREDK